MKFTEMALKNNAKFEFYGSSLFIIKIFACKVAVVVNTYGFISMSAIKWCELSGFGTKSNSSFLQGVGVHTKLFTNCEVKYFNFLIVKWNFLNFLLGQSPPYFSMSRKVRPEKYQNRVRAAHRGVIGYPVRLLEESDGMSSMWIPIDSEQLKNRILFCRHMYTETARFQIHFSNCSWWR